MSLLLAQTKIIALVESIGPTRVSRGLPPTFKHFPKAHRLALPDSRGFFLESGPRRLDDWMGKLDNAHILKQQNLVVCYRRDTDKLAIEQAMDEDADEIMRVLLNPTGWQRPTYSIVSIDAGDGMVAETIEENDHLLLVLTFNLEVTP